MEELAVNPQNRNPIKEYLKKFNLNLCLTCGTCTSGCPISGMPGMEGWDTRKTLRMLASWKWCQPA